MIHVLLSDKGLVIGAADNFSQIKVSTKHTPGYGLSHLDAVVYVQRLHLIYPHHNFLVLPEIKARKTTYRISIAPQVGDQVASVLEGDYTPAGIIVKTSKSFNRIDTSTGETFVRLPMSHKWKCGKKTMIVVERAIKMDNKSN